MTGPHRYAIVAEALECVGADMWLPSYYQEGCEACQWWVGWHTPRSAQTQDGFCDNLLWVDTWKLIGYELWHQGSQRRPGYMREAYYAEPNPS